MCLAVATALSAMRQVRLSPCASRIVFLHSPQRAASGAWKPPSELYATLRRVAMHAAANLKGVNAEQFHHLHHEVQVC